jgi:hypothetical protein
MIERLRATFRAEKYEGEGQRLGSWMVLVVVSWEEGGGPSFFKKLLSWSCRVSSAFT